jgi:hypothetical protein
MELRLALIGKTAGLRPIDESSAKIVFKSFMVRPESVQVCDATSTGTWMLKFCRDVVRFFADSLASLAEEPPEQEPFRARQERWLDYLSRP